MHRTFAIGACLLLSFSTYAFAASNGSSFKTNSGQVSSVELTASSAQVIRGQDLTLLWNAELAKNCQASGDWQGAKANRANETIKGLTRSGRYVLECQVLREPGTNARYITASVNVEIIEAEEVNVALNASSTSVRAGDSVTLDWQADNASQCTASGDWVGPQPASGSKTISGIDSNRTFTLSCGTGSSSALASVTISADTPKLEWIPPATDVNGEALTALSGYRIYWGTQPGVYTNSELVEDPSATQWHIAAAPGDYFFAMSAISADDEESALSNEIRKTVPARSTKPDSVFESLAQHTGPAHATTQPGG